MAQKKNRNPDGIKIVCQNKKARHDFEIVETVEAGLVLQGTEVKSLREGRANLKDSYAKIRGGEVWLYDVHISPYPHASYNNHEPERTRKLLLHRREIRRLLGKTQEKGLTLVPLKIYFKRGKAKVELALARGKKAYDKRQRIKEKEEAREMDRLRKKYHIS
ncbi:SsrA-binding protein [Desulfacinum hydrothermale DSM 13146]|uniref:SsrA-binding protein n=1 Tax=Desulfacinum hydrothermale DSM 13146 TaxID=1121390 RepID=A0A1W1XV51_9BACT|nr:SsrA-binding protein SmpB [Desulfacinum hydrothermale]SMC27823.1 SsrA-binding protein [Desulfacinum hydrothermale DSM 13146]